MYFVSISKSVQLPCGFYTHSLDSLTYAISSEYAKLKHSSKEAGFCHCAYVADVHCHIGLHVKYFTYVILSRWQV